MRKTKKMNNDPCQKEKEEFHQAATEWILAAGKAMQFLPFDQLDPNNKIELKSPSYIKEMIGAFKHERSARVKYMQKWRAIYECLRLHK
jgi:hypothetical protein